MIKKLISERCYCALDVGAQTLKASAIKILDNHTPELIGVYETKTVGFKDASVTDLKELSECINTTLSGLLSRAGLKLREIQLGIGGELIDKRLSNAVIPLTDRGNKVISLQDVKKIQTQARMLGVKMEEIILHDFPQYYKVDDVNTASNPVGLYGRKLEIGTLLVVVNNTVLKNLHKAVNEAGYDVANMFFSSYASAEACLNEFYRKQGCILVDIGAAVSDILFFKEGQLRSLEVIPWGADQITRVIANQLNLSFMVAEDIKISYGAASNDPQSDEEILIKREESYIPVRKQVINQAMDPEITKFIDLVNDFIKKAGVGDQLNVGVILVGGGALLGGIPERLEQGINLPVKMGKVNIAVKKLHQAAKFASVVGLAQMGGQKSFARQASAEGQNWLAHTMYKVKELYQEYF